MNEELIFDEDYDYPDEPYPDDDETDEDAPAGDEEVTEGEETPEETPEELPEETTEEIPEELPEDEVILGTLDNPSYVLGAEGYTVEVSNFPAEVPAHEKDIATYTPTEFMLMVLVLWVVGRDLLQLFIRKWGAADFR